MTKVFAVSETVTLNGLVDSHTSSQGVDRLEDFRVDWGGALGRSCVAGMRLVAQEGKSMAGTNAELARNYPSSDNFS